MERGFYKRLILSASSFLMISLSALSARATTAIMLSDREMVVGARLILTGTVENVFSAWDEDHRMIWSYVEIRRDRLLRGKLDESSIVLRQMGGVAGDRSVRVFGEPQFSPGQRVLVYLDTAADGSLRVAQSFMGMFVITHDPNTGLEVVSRRLDGTEVRVLPRPDSEVITNNAGLQEYTDWVKALIRHEAARIAEADAARAGDPLLVIPAEYDRATRRGAGYSPEYVFTAGGVRWMQADSGQAITYHINPANCPVGGGAQAETSRAMLAWPNQSGANIHLEMGSQTSGCGLDFDGQNEISFGDCKGQLPPPTGSCSGIVAMTSVEYSSESKVVSGINFQALIEAHTVFARGMDCLLGKSANLAEIMCHELGHSIGFAHSADPSALMWAMAHGNNRDATLGADDKAGALVIYPAASGGGGLNRPVINRAKLKTSGKLIVIGDNFTADSRILLNGEVLPASEISFDPSSGRLVFRGSASFGAPGSNVLVVINSAGSSSAFVF
jgi:hypothetical protein